MKRFSSLRCSVLVLSGLLAAPAFGDLTVTVGPSGDTTGTTGTGWNAFMNVFELDGVTPVFQSGWGVADLNATFDDGASKLTLSPNTIGDPDPFWYIGGGGPGAPGNKIMDANLYQEFAAGDLAGETLTFEGTVLSNTFTAAHETKIFIKDFAPDFSSFFVTEIVAAPGPFSISLALNADPGRHVQYGFETIGVNVWATDTAPFGNVMIATPEPASLALLSIGGLALLRRRKA